MKILVKVKTNAKVNKIEKNIDGWRAQLKSPPRRGKANAELIEVLSDYFDCPQSSVQIIRGHTAKQKLIVIKD